MVSKDLGSTIQQLRRSAGLTQEALADKAHIAYSTLAKIERGAIDSPSIFTVASIAQVLHVSIDELLQIKPVRPHSHQQSERDICFVYCDLNGVLVRFFQRAFVDIAEKTDIPIDKIETLYMHFNDAADRGEISVGEFNELMAKRLGLKDFNWERYYMNSVDPIKPMSACLEKLSHTMPVGLISNTREGFIDTLKKKNIIPNIAYSAVLDSSQVGVIKPEPHMFELAEQAAGVPASQILLIDDSRTNLMAAEARGWHVIWFDSYHPRESVKRVYEALEAPLSKI